jgi:hypothetical protein
MACEHEGTHGCEEDKCSSCHAAKSASFGLLPMGCMEYLRQKHSIHASSVLEYAH